MADILFALAIGVPLIAFMWAASFIVIYQLVRSLRNAKQD